MNLLQYVPGDSFLHKLNPVTKLFAAFLYGVACIVTQSVWVEIVLIMLMLAISTLAG